MCAKESYTYPGTQLLQACSAHLTPHKNGHSAAHPQKLHTAAQPVSPQYAQETHQPIHSTTQPPEAQPMDVQGDREGRPYYTSASPLQHYTVKRPFHSCIVGAGLAPALARGRPYYIQASPLQPDHVKWAIHSCIVGVGLALPLPSPLAPALVLAVAFSEHPNPHEYLRFDNPELRKT